MDLFDDLEFSREATEVLDNERDFLEVFDLFDSTDSLDLDLAIPSLEFFEAPDRIDSADASLDAIDFDLDLLRDLLATGLPSWLLIIPFTSLTLSSSSEISLTPTSS